MKISKVDMSSLQPSSSPNSLQEGIEALSALSKSIQSRMPEEARLSQEDTSASSVSYVVHFDSLVKSFLEKKA